MDYRGYSILVFAEPLDGAYEGTYFIRRAVPSFRLGGERHESRIEHSGVVVGTFPTSAQAQSEALAVAVR